jgi:hypothetical protein
MKLITRLRLLNDSLLCLSLFYEAARSKIIDDLARWSEYLQEVAGSSKNICMHEHVCLYLVWVFSIHKMYLFTFAEFLDIAIQRLHIEPRTADCRHQ